MGSGIRSWSTAMKWYERLAEWATARGRSRTIPDRDNPSLPYIFRHYILFKRRSWTQRWLGNVVLHQLMASDPASLHDHPWPYITIILAGGYWEHTPKGRFWRKPGTILVRRATSLHRLEMDPDAGPVWTLFITGPKFRGWGFASATGWVPHEEYHARRAK